jgi:hypothetical protein
VHDEMGEKKRKKKKPDLCEILRRGKKEINKAKLFIFVE